MEYEIWCRCLRQYRQKLELTQQEVAQRIGISRPHYSAIEHGRTVINYRHLYNLAKAFRIRLVDLIAFPGLSRKGRVIQRTRATRRSSKQRWG